MCSPAWRSYLNGHWSKPHGDSQWTAPAERSARSTEDPRAAMIAADPPSRPKPSHDPAMRCDPVSAVESEALGAVDDGGNGADHRRLRIKPLQELSATKQMVIGLRCELRVAHEQLDRARMQAEAALDANRCAEALLAKTTSQAGARADAALSSGPHTVTPCIHDVWHGLRSLTGDVCRNRVRPVGRRLHRSPFVRVIRHRRVEAPGAGRR